MGEDKCSWKFTSHGEYSVKTTYHYIMESLMDNSDLRVPDNWMKIWNMKSPQKIKFSYGTQRGAAFRQGKEFAPDEFNVRIDVFIVRDLMKNVWHVFFGCNKVEEVWVEAELWNFIQDKLEIVDGFVDLFFQMLELLFHDSLHMFGMTMWCIWKCGNEKLWDEVETRHAISIKLARESLYKWQQVRAKQQRMENDSGSIYDTRIERHNRNNIIQWRKPALGGVKCNVDAAIFKDQRCYDVGMC